MDESVDEGKAKTKLDQKSTADLDRVTKEVEGRVLDAGSVGALLTSQTNKQGDTPANVRIRDEDVRSLMAEMDLDKISAEKELRRNGGSLVAALTALVNDQ
mmetsp:Transcript_7331/g.14997  ORF Transcript_7331/g.14997 Transcript_7331/m.14997 type:complete len:101 (-) Transcript_7331:623-925(-)|eukprot:CAMPEP_0184690876 /NCGR_PEP_ID=MMETSP0312-20130426/31484_1 /TAXON_ID=31354 /ORGANISM="Compsopogon coeruleus, Strain SAG 36.94" /LENGTH=100 /DNA_ID=CAMNT_0027148447 /DNA_START=692 /DNA_END=994 /DNA_ORIENTATION=-